MTTASRMHRLTNVVDGLTCPVDPDAAPLDLVIASDAPPRHATADDASLPTTDGAGALALPGFTDLHARLREPGPSVRGTIGSEARAALAAGFTRVCCAPDTVPAIDSTATVELVLARAAAARAARVLPVAALTVALDGARLAELATLADAGCVAAGHADVPIADTRLLHDAMRYAASFELPLILRAADASLGVHGCAHDGATATRLGLRGIPVAAETIALTRLIELVRETGARVHVSRLSSARAVDLIAAAKSDGLPISCDVGIAHLHFIDEDIDGFDTRFASAVPFRSRDDRDALRAGLADGTIDAICSDHAPLDADASLAPFPLAERGLSTYDGFLPMLLSLASNDLPLARLVSAITAAPAALLRREMVYGDAVLLDVDASADAWRSAGQNAPHGANGMDPFGPGALRAAFLSARAVVLSTTAPS